ncbi:TetR/AcrR family transcriptional regulator [Flexivirga caeni]|uniref:TetR/AcrR family transcriptional regulator n=1 Tax=Flexivirga caeni TaxID=2294115 RepID=A0A3M9MIP7_9MICO|nr:TetR/AcrR family transcriptional regulator [Flexivirga caeni]
MPARLRIVGPMAPKRALTSHRITSAAQQLAVEKGYDDFTLDELAERAGVSRRTLFNYFDSKLEATIGGGPQLQQSDVDTFLSGGPTGEFIDDVATLVLAILRASAELTREDWRTMRRCFELNPKLVIAAHGAFSEFVEGVQELLAQRSDIPGEDPRGQVLVAIFGAVFDVSLRDFITEDDERDLATIFLHNLSVARRILH